MSDEAKLYRDLIEEFVAATKHGGQGGSSPWRFVARFAQVLEDGKELHVDSSPGPPVETGAPAVGAPKRVTLAVGLGRALSIVRDGWLQSEDGQAMAVNYMPVFVAEREAAGLRAKLEASTDRWEAAHADALRLGSARFASAVSSLDQDAETYKLNRNIGPYATELAERFSSLDPAARELLDEMAELKESLRIKKAEHACGVEYLQAKLDAALKRVAALEADIAAKGEAGRALFARIAELETRLAEYEADRDAFKAHTAPPADVQAEAPKVETEPRELSEAGRRVLQDAAAREGGFVCPTRGLKAAVQASVLGRLLVDGYITDGPAPTITEAGRARLIVCSTCSDTHVMTLHKSNGDEQQVPCTFCPTPCSVRAYCVRRSGKSAAVPADVARLVESLRLHADPGGPERHYGHILIHAADALEALARENAALRAVAGAARAWRKAATIGDCLDAREAMRDALAKLDAGQGGKTGGGT